MKEYFHGLFTTELENCTLNCTQVQFVESIRKRGNDVAAFAKLSHVTYVRTATDGNMSVVALSLEKGFFDVATYQR